MIVTGVIHNSNAAWFYDDTYNAISLEFEQHCANCPNDDHDDCWCTDGNETLLIGFTRWWREDKDDNEGVWFSIPHPKGGFAVYLLDESAEYSAICSTPYTQIVQSRWAAECNRCSPCYPGQGDLDTPGTDYLAYCLPPDRFDDTDGFDVSRIKEVE